MPKISHVICDLSDVLIKGLEGTEHQLSLYLGKPVEEVAADIFNENFNSFWFGEESEDSFFQRLITKHKWSIDLPALKVMLRENFKEIEGTRQIYSTLCAKYPSTLFSVNALEWVEYLEGNFPYEHMFETVHYSYDLKYTKRQKEGFEFILQQNNLSPAEVLFIDDSEINIEIARSCNINAVRFVTPEQLSSELKQQNIL